MYTVVREYPKPPQTPITAKALLLRRTILVFCACLAQKKLSETLRIPAQATALQGWPTNSRLARLGIDAVHCGATRWHGSSLLTRVPLSGVCRQDNVTHFDFMGVNQRVCGDYRTLEKHLIFHYAVKHLPRAYCITQFTARSCLRCRKNAVHCVGGEGAYLLRSVFCRVFFCCLCTIVTELEPPVLCLLRVWQ